VHTAAVGKLPVADRLLEPMAHGGGVRTDGGRSSPERIRLLSQHKRIHSQKEVRTTAGTRRPGKDDASRAASGNPP
jgi:hypothetical protein